MIIAFVEILFFGAVMLFKVVLVSVFRANSLATESREIQGRHGVFVCLHGLRRQCCRSWIPP